MTMIILILISTTMMMMMMRNDQGKKHGIAEGDIGEAGSTDEVGVLMTVQGGIG